MADETDGQLASAELSERLVQTYIEWNLAHPEATTQTAVNGLIDGCSKLLFRLLQGAAFPAESIDALDDTLSRLRRRVLEREP